MNWDCHVHVFGSPGRFPLASTRGYAPPVRTIEQVESAAAAAGIAHLVLVQPSVYGTDNRCLLDALRAGAGRHRAVVVLAPGYSILDLERLHEIGVRGVRFNLVSPDGNGLEDFEGIARDIAPLGWHVQFQITPLHLPQLRALRKLTKVPFVLDHFAGLRGADSREEGRAGELIELLVRGDCWLKFSGFYRLSEEPDYRDMDTLLLELANVAADRVLWGSDWPHTWFFRRKNAKAPEYEATLAPLRRCLPAELRLKALQDNPWRLYL